MHFVAEVAPAVQARMRFDMLDTAVELIEQAKNALQEGTLTDGLVDCIRDVRDEMDENLTFFDRHRLCGRDTLRTIHGIRQWADDFLLEIEDGVDGDQVCYLT